MAVGFGLINLLLVVGAKLGVISQRGVKYVWLLVLFVMLRTLFLGTIENPETRYTLECYPAVIAMGAAWLGARMDRRAREG